MVIINGSLDNLQSSVDFYLSITSKSNIASPKDMRDKFFAMFKEEDSHRSENFLQYQERVSDDYSIVDNPKPMLSEGEEEFTLGKFSFYSDSKNLENENISDEYSSSDLEYEYVELENEEISFEKEEELSDIEDTKSENEYVETENEIDELEDDEFIDYSSSENEVASLEEENIETENEEDEFVTWGSYDEEVEDDSGDEDEVSDTWGNYDNEEIEEDVKDNWGNYNEDEEIEELEEVENSNWGSMDDLGLTEEDWGDSDLEDIGVFNNTLVQEEEVVVKNKVVDVQSKEVEDVIEDVPKDLREFVKKYHNCEMSFALKYFTKKEIDKQLSLGRIFKRKNRLLV